MYAKYPKKGFSKIQAQLIIFYTTQFDDEIVVLQDGVGNKKKGVIKCYTDKKRKLMEDELGVISQVRENSDTISEQIIYCTYLNF